MNNSSARRDGDHFYKFKSIFVEFNFFFCVWAASDGAWDSLLWYSGFVWCEDGALCPGGGT